MTLSVRVLGELAVERDGEAVPLPRGRRLRALLRWLALHPAPQPRVEVAGRLWPDVLDQRARTSLRSALAELRRAVGRDLLTATRDTVRVAEGVGLTCASSKAARGRGTPRRRSRWCEAPCSRA